MDHDDFSDKKFRKTLNITIINNFLDLSNFSDDSSNYKTLCAFFDHVRNSFKEIPHIFVSNSSCEQDHETTEKKDDEYLSSAFTEWLMMWLLKVLSHPCTSFVHKECEDLFISLLNLIKFNNVQYFREKVPLMINLLKELNEIADKFENSSEPPVCLQNYFKHHRMDTQELELIDISIMFHNCDECEALQQKVTFILGKITLDISQFIPDQLMNIWKIFCTQIEIGSLILKKESFLALEFFIRNCGLIFSPSLVNYLLNCVAAVLKFCIIFKDETADYSRELLELEDSIALFLPALTDAFEKPMNKYTLNTASSCKFLQMFMKTILLPGFMNTKDDFQLSVVNSLVCLLKHSRKNGYPMPYNTQQKYSESLLKLFLTNSKEHKALIPLLKYFILIEFEDHSSSEAPIRSLESYSSFENMSHKSKTWQQLYEDVLSKLCSNNLSNLEKVIAPMAIMIHCFCKVAHSDKVEWKCSQIYMKFPPPNKNENHNLRK
nr:uncharacterized protein LOC107447424 [Parasteatoda tepidariorum]